MSTTQMRRPEANPGAAKSFGGDILSLAQYGRSSIHPDPKNRRPVVALTAGVEEHLFAARFGQYEKIARALVEEFDCQHYERAADRYESWGPRYAELNDPDQARECHSIATALRQRVELIRRYPGEFSDVLAVLADVAAEKRQAL